MASVRHGSEAKAFRIGQRFSHDGEDRRGEVHVSRSRATSDRRDEWIAAGLFDRIANEAISGYDKVIGLDLSEVAVDGSLHKAPSWRRGNGQEADRSSEARMEVIHPHRPLRDPDRLDGRRGEPQRLGPPRADLGRRWIGGLLAEIETLWLDRGYDSEVTRERIVRRGIDDAVIARKRKRGSSGETQSQPMGLRWPVERRNPRLANYGQRRRSY